MLKSGNAVRCRSTTEEVYLHKEFRGSHDHVFAMARSNQAIYIPVQKLVLKRDSCQLGTFGARPI